MSGLRALAGIVLALGAIAGQGCTSPLWTSVPETRLVESGRYAIILGVDVPRVRSVEGCGAQALAAVLARETPGGDAQAIADELPWHDVGATPVDVLLAARRRGCSAEIARGTWDLLAANVRGDRLSLVMLDAAPEVRTLVGRVPTTKVMHWAVVSGIAIDGSAVLLAARDGRHHVVEREEFERRWERSDCCVITVGGSMRRRGCSGAIGIRYASRGAVRDEGTAPLRLGGR